MFALLKAKNRELLESMERDMIIGCKQQDNCSQMRSEGTTIANRTNWLIGTSFHEYIHVNESFLITVAHPLIPLKTTAQVMAAGSATTPKNQHHQQCQYLLVQLCLHLKCNRSLAAWSRLSRSLHSNTCLDTSPVIPVLTSGHWHSD